MRKVFIRQFLAKVLRLTPQHITRLFSPGYNPGIIRQYLAECGYSGKRKPRKDPANVPLSPGKRMP